MGVKLHSGVGNRMGGRAGSRRRRPKGLMSEINVTPFVDVMLVLLIIFMVTAPLMVTGVTVDLPEAKTEPIPGQDEPLNIGVKKTGEIYINTMKVELGDLVPKLTAATESKRKKDTRIFVSGDRDVDYGLMVKVLAALSESGFIKISLVTEQEEK